MAQQFMEIFRILVAEEESVPGTMETPTSANFLQKIKNIAVSVNVDMEAYKYATGHHGEAESISGKQFGTITFEILKSWGGAATTPPAYALFDKACGQYPHTYSSTGIAFHPLKCYDEHTLTIWVYDIQAGNAPGAICYKYAGCVGNCVEGADGVGKPIVKKYTFTGKLVDIDFNVANGSIPILNNIESTCTDKFWGTLSVNNNARLVNSFQLDYGNEVTALEDQSDSTGIQHYSITKRAPRLTINPLVQLNLDDYNLLNSGATGCAQAVPVVITTNHFKYTIPKARLTAGSIAARDGRIGMDMTFECGFNGVSGIWSDTGIVGDTGILGEATFEILQGTK